MDTKQTFIAENLETVGNNKNTSFDISPLLTNPNDAKMQLDYLEMKFKNKYNKKKPSITSTSYDFNSSIENVQKSKLEEFFNKSSKNKYLLKLNNSVESERGGRRDQKSSSLNQKEKNQM